MAKIAKNIVMQGASGKLGDQIVIRQRGGETILSQAPGPRTKEPTEGQKTHQARFQEAILYGQGVAADPAAKAEYATKADARRSAYNVAVADFMNAPSVDEVDVTSYHGAVGDTIRVRAIDDFKVVQVQLSIYNADGTMVEQGNAVQQDNKIDWLYTATANNESTAGDKIVIRASDKPGHFAEEERAM